MALTTLNLIYDFRVEYRNFGSWVAFSGRAVPRPGDFRVDNGSTSGRVFKKLFYQIVYDLWHFSKYTYNGIILYKIAHQMNVFTRLHLV